MKRLKVGGNRLDSLYGADHPNLDALRRQVNGQVVQGLQEKFSAKWLIINDSKGGLDGQRCDNRGAEEAMSSKGLEVGSDASTAARIMPGDGQNDRRIVKKSGA